MSRWDPKDRERWARAMMIVFGGWVVAGVVAAAQAIGTTYYYGSSNSSASGTCNDGGPCQPIFDANGYAKPPSGCVEGALLSASSDAGPYTCNGNLVTIDNAGNVSMAVGATIDGMDPSATKAIVDNLPARVISSDEFKAGTQDWDYCFKTEVTTTNATATVFHRIAMPQASQLHIAYTCNATQFDGGAIVSARYERRLTSTLADGGSAPSTVGGIDTIGTARENDSTWGGPNAVTYDGGSSTGIVELNLQGVAGQTVNWECSGCWKRLPRADSGIP